MTDDDFLDAFAACRLSSADFDHRAHLRAAWVLVNRLPLEVAIEQTCSGIKRIAAHFGAPDKYNRTMSEALVRLIAQQAAHAASATFDEFLNANPHLMNNAREELAKHYSSDLLHSAEAKHRFIAPDREPLP